MYCQEENEASPKMDESPRSELTNESRKKSNIKDSVIATNLHAICTKHVSPLITRRKRDVAKDMEALILSRQDDPFLQVFVCFFPVFVPFSTDFVCQALACRETKNEDAEMNDDLVCLIPGSNKVILISIDHSFGCNILLCVFRASQIPRAFPYQMFTST